MHQNQTRSRQDLVSALPELIHPLLQQENKVWNTIRYSNFATNANTINVLEQWRMHNNIDTKHMGAVMGPVATRDGVAAVPRLAQTTVSERRPWPKPASSRTAISVRARNLSSSGFATLHSLHLALRQRQKRRNSKTCKASVLSASCKVARRSTYQGSPQYPCPP